MILNKRLNITFITTVFLTSFAIIFGSIGSYSFEKSFAHNFSPDESAYFLTIVDKIKVELELAGNSTSSNNQSSAIVHANNALLNYDSNTQYEISERNERIANELDDTLNELLEQVKSQTDKSQLDNTVETIDAIIEEAITTRIDQEQLNNLTIQALVLANIVDAALQNYGNAFNFGIDLTNMSNMMMHTTTSDNKTTHGGNNHGSNDINRHTNIVNFTNYQSALAFSNNAFDRFHNEIKPSLIQSQSETAEESNNTTANQTHLEKLENGLVELNNAIKNKETPMKVMEVVHTQIHPNLQVLFNLKID